MSDFVFSPNDYGNAYKNKKKVLMTHDLTSKDWILMLDNYDRYLFDRQLVTDEMVKKSQAQVNSIWEFQQPFG